jgi:hypothetical protein
MILIRISPIISSQRKCSKQSKIIDHSYYISFFYNELNIEITFVKLYISEKYSQLTNADTYINNKNYHKTFINSS